MNKLELKKVEKWDITIDAREYCVYCGTNTDSPMGVTFKYIQEEMELIYHMCICIPCYICLIKDRSLNELKSFIPLLRLKDNRHTQELLKKIGTVIYNIGYKP